MTEYNVLTFGTVTEPPNSNALAGMQCPRCGSQGPFRITAVCVVRVFDDTGINETTDVEWTEEEEATCESCSLRVTVQDMMIYPLSESEGKVDLSIVAMFCKNLGFEVSTKYGDDAQVTLHTADGDVALYGRTIEGAANHVVDIRKLNLSANEWLAEVRLLGPMNLRQIVAVMWLLAERRDTADVSDLTLTALGLDHTFTSNVWPLGYYTTGWFDETEETEDGRAGVEYLMINDPDGEEYAVIIHRTNTSLSVEEDQRVRKEKLDRAEAICAALNAKEPQ